MKKIITTALIAAMLTVSLAGCKNNDEPGNSGNSGTSSTDSSTGSTDSSTGSTDSNTSSDTTSSGDTGASGGDSSAPAAEGKSPAVRLKAMFDKFPELFGATEGMAMVVAGPSADAIKEVFPDPADPEHPTHCVSMVDESANVASMMQLTQLNLEDCEDYIMAVPMISAQLKQIVIVKPKAGKEEAVKSALNQFADFAKQPQPMEYPTWEEERAGTHFGETDDGCCYVVVAVEGADMGSAIENA